MNSSFFTNKVTDKLFAYQYICIYIVLFGPVKPDLGVIPLGQKKKKNNIQQ